MQARAPTIHVVDDDDAIRTAVSRLLRASGYRVAAYASALDFLDERDTDGADCILLDINMPGMNGLELQRRLASDPHPLPVVFLTSQAEGRTRAAALAAGAAAFLVKPVERIALLAAIERALRAA